MLKIAFFSIFSVASAVAAPAPSPSPSVDPLANLPARELVISFAKDRAPKVGDFLTYELSPGPGGDQAVVDPKSGGWKVGVSFRENRVVIPLVAGQHVLPALPILDSSGAVVAKTDPVQMTIESSLTPEERQGSGGKPPEPAPARGPLSLEIPGWVQNVLAGVIGISFLTLLFYAIRWSKKRAARLLGKILPSKPIDQRALDRLAELQKKSGPGKHKILHFGISETLKEYLGARFDFDAQESTTSELLEGLKERLGTAGLDASRVRKIAECFAVLDLVKFTDYVPSEKESDAQTEAAREIVLSTRFIDPGPGIAAARTKEVNR